MDVPTIFAHCRAPQERDFDLLAAAGTGIAQAPKTYLKHGGQLPQLINIWKKEFQSGWLLMAR